MNNLKPCPFCGNDQIDMFTYDPFDGYQGDCSTTKIFCTECGASVSASIEANTIVRWNNRICERDMKVQDFDPAKFEGKTIDEICEEMVREALAKIVVEPIAGEGQSNE